MEATSDLTDSLHLAGESGELHAEEGEQQQ